MQHEDDVLNEATAEVLIEQYCHLMECQLLSMRTGNLSRVETLGNQMDELVAGITRRAPGAPAISEHRRSCLRDLRNQLELALRAEMEDVGDRLKRLRQVKKVVGLCRDSVMSR